MEAGEPEAKKQKTEETKNAVDAYTKAYTKVRFIGIAIPTTPASIVPIGDPNGTGAVAGSYLGSECLQADIKGRLAVLAEAVRTARERLPEQEEEGVMNVFMAPEFFWHSPEGPYLHHSTSPVSEMLKALTDAFPKSEYPNWLFVCGTAITAKIDNKEKLYGLSSTLTRNAVVESLCKQWRHSYGPLSEVILDMITNFIKNCHAYPLLEVRNRALIVSNLALDVPGSTASTTNCMTTEKYYCSNEDFLLYEVNGKNVVTEQMCTYRPIDLTAGDVKKTPLDNYAIFRINHGNGNQVLDAAVEICLDHRDVRLRRNLGKHPFHLQLIPSCGMQIKENGCAVEEGGLVFNVDGQYAFGQGAKSAQKGTLNRVDCLFAEYVDADDANYGAHSQPGYQGEKTCGGRPRQPQGQQERDVSRRSRPGTIDCSACLAHQRPSYILCGRAG